MVIQRIQTLFLLLALVCLGAFLFVPFGFWDVVEKPDVNVGLVDLVGRNYTALLLPTVVSAILVSVAIFSYKNMAFQKLMIVLSVLANIAAMGVVIFIMTRGFVGETPEITVKALWSGGGLLLVAALIGQIAAYRGVSRDQKLLRSYDRLR